MAQRMVDSLVAQVGTGAKAPATLNKFPELGATATVLLKGGTSPTAIVQLRGWVDDEAKEVLATFTLPVTSGPKLNDLYDSVVVASAWDKWDWNVVSLTGGGSLDLSLIGVGI